MDNISNTLPFPPGNCDFSPEAPLAERPPGQPEAATATEKDPCGEASHVRGPGKTNRIYQRTQIKNGVTYTSADWFTDVYPDGKKPESFNLGRDKQQAEKLNPVLHEKHRAGAPSVEIRTWLNIQLGRTPQLPDEGGYANIDDLLGFKLGDRKIGIEPSTFEGHQSRAWKAVRSVVANAKHDQPGTAYSADECPKEAKLSTAILTGKFAQDYKNICRDDAQGKGTPKSRFTQACNDLRLFAALLKKKHLRMYAQELAKRGLVLPDFSDFRKVALADKQAGKQVVAPSDGELRAGEVAVDRLRIHGESVSLAGRLSREAGLYSKEIDQAHGSWLVMTPSGPQLRVPGRRARAVPISLSLHAALAARGNDFFLSGTTLGERRAHRETATRKLREYGFAFRNSLQECREHFAWFISATRKPAVAMRAMGCRTYAVAAPYLEAVKKLTPEMTALWPR